MQMRNHARVKGKIKKEWEGAHKNQEDNTQHFHKRTIFEWHTHTRHLLNDTGWTRWCNKLWRLNDYWMIQWVIFWMIHYWIMSDDWMVILNDRLNDKWAIEWLKHSWIKMLNEEDWLW